MTSPVRIYAGTQEGLFVWRSKNGSWEKVAVFFETGPSMGYEADPTLSI
jgi:hypothetical protein